jgi:hypothetical protein
MSGREKYPHSRKSDEITIHLIVDTMNEGRTFICSTRNMTIVNVDILHYHENTGQLDMK